MMNFVPDKWFWIVAGDESRAWSSERGAYVDTYPDDRLTRIASEQELSDVLRPYGLTGPHVTEQDYAAAIQWHVDATAKSKGYADGMALAGYYSASTIPAWGGGSGGFHFVARSSVDLCLHRTFKVSGRSARDAND